MTPIPTLETDRLILRAPVVADFDAMAAFLAEERSSGVGGPMNRAAAWRVFATDFGHWHIRGYGMFAVEEKSSCKTAGMVGFWYPDGWPEVELGWTAYKGFEGKSIAYAAAKRVRQHAYDDLGWGALISIILPDNTRSIALAEQLGAKFERDWVSPGGTDAVIYRHPAPEAIK
ncbi:MAG: GNAT family N-acetyltransferase [Paracoccaceae bacterium]